MVGVEADMDGCWGRMWIGWFEVNLSSIGVDDYSGVYNVCKHRDAEVVEVCHIAQGTYVITERNMVGQEH